MIVVLDTNVLVSGILRLASDAGTILRLAAAGMIKLAYDQRIMVEYREVLSRPVFDFPPGFVNDLLLQFQADGLFVVATPLPFRLPDVSDAPFLEVALAGRVEAIVTGNKKHFAAGKHPVPVLSPAELIRLLRFGG